MPQTHTFNLPESKRWIIDHRYELSQWIDDPKTQSALQNAREYSSAKRGVVQHDFRSANYQ